MNGSESVAVVDGRMDYDTSFGDFADGKKFIAVVVSDNEDDYNSWEGSGPDEELKSPLNSSIRSTDGGVVVSGGTSGKVAVVKSKCEEKKRWSFMSSHSPSSGTAKKRWSALSTFTMDSGTAHSRESKEKESRDAKFIKRVSTHSSLSSHKRGSIISNVSGVVSSEGDQGTKSPHTLKRSSTGSSLRQLFGLIALNDDNKENNAKSERESFKQPSANASKSVHQNAQPKERRNSNFRAPLTPIVNEANRQRHSVMLGNNGYGNYSMSTVATSRESGSRIHTHSPSISSLSSINSSSSKWRFWKRNKNTSLSRSSSTQSLNPTPDTSSINENKVKNRSSLADLHKSLFSHSNNNGGNGSGEFNDASSIASSTLSKRPSSSSLSINGLKHRSSQSSLKHKTSHSSLQRFKTRRKSNNNCGNGDDCSSTNSQGPQISLPVPDQVSRDKIRAKLRNSTSLLSLGSSTPVVMKDYDDALMAQILELCDTKHVVDERDIMPSLADSRKLTTHVWSSRKDETAIFKKLPLGTLEDVTYSKAMCLQELKMLRLAKGTTGLPRLLHSHVIREEIDQDGDAKLFLLLVLKNHGSPLSTVNLTSWSQALHIFWQCVTILYVAETKFQFEHRNLILEHILVDKNLNVTLCDLKCSRAQMSPDQPVIYTRLDHPLFFQGGGDYQYEIYKIMRFILAETHSWDSYEPRTNLLWLHYLCVKFFQRYENKLHKSGSARDKLGKLAQLVDPSTSIKRGLFKRHEIEIKTCGDLLRFK